MGFGQRQDRSLDVDDWMEFLRNTVSATVIDRKMDRTDLDHVVLIEPATEVIRKVPILKTI